MWRDSRGRRLSDYDQPSVAVDVAVLTYSDEQLRVVVVERPDGALVLPGAFLHIRERLADAAARALLKADLSGVDFQQLAVFDDPDRDDRGWVLSVGHVAAMPLTELPADARLVDVVDGAVAESLLFDHALIVERAVHTLREQYGSALDPNRLCGSQFTVLELRRLYEAVFGHPLPKDSFRRYVQHHLEDTGEVNSDVVGRPAAVFRRKAYSPLPAAARSFLLTGGR